MNLLSRGFYPRFWKLAFTSVICLLPTIILQLFLTAPLAAQQNVEQVYRLVRQLEFPAVSGWKARKGEFPGSERPSLDDSGWDSFDYQPVLEADQCWFRVELSLPEKIALQSVAGRPVILNLDILGKGEIYQDGRKLAALKAGENRVKLGPPDRAGDKLKIAVRIDGEYQKVVFRGATLELDSWRKAVEQAQQLQMTIFAAARLLGNDTRQRSMQLEQDPKIDLSSLPVSRKQELMLELDRVLGGLDQAAVSRGDPKAFAASVDNTFARLRNLTDYFQGYTIHLVSNAHIDLAWLWRWRETVEASHDTFESVLDLMRRYPELAFTQSQAQLYEWMKEYYPATFAEIKRRVAEGRWEVAGGMWVEPDCNLISGESWVRQILYATRFFQRNFGVKVKIGWNPDSFGYNWNMPQFFRRSGIEVFLTQKLLWNDTNIFPYHLFWWKGPDGSRILVYMPYIGYTNIVNAYQMVDALRQFEANTGLKDMAFLIGYGDHGGGPDRYMLEQARRIQRHPVFPKVEFGTMEQYLKALPDSVKARLPEYGNELYLEYHQGTYTSQAAMKAANRELEQSLGAAEELAALTDVLFAETYPQERLERAWKKVLFNQMHDILPGSGITAIYQDALKNYGEARHLAQLVSKGALLGFAGRIDTRSGPAGQPLVVFNTLSWPRGGVARLEGEAGQFQDCSVYAVNGRRVPCQVVQSGLERSALIFRADSVPAGGYRVYKLEDNVHLSNEMPSGLKISSAFIENEFIRLELDQAGGLISRIYDKRSRREVLAPGGKGNLLELFEDKPANWDAWNIGYTGVSWRLDKADRVEVVEKGPVRATIRVRRSFLGATKPRRPLATSFPSSFFTQEISLYAGSPLVEVRNSIDWWEQQVLCKAAWEVNVSADTAYYEIPLAAIGRPTTRTSSLDKARFEVPALRWADLSGKDYGVSLLSDSKYGYDIAGNRMRLTLLKAPLWPDPSADRGTHEFRYALYPHPGDWRTGGTVRVASGFCQPLLVQRGIPHSGSLPASGAGFLSAAPENVIISSFKLAEDGNGMIVRCYESAGAGQTSARIVLPPGAVKAQETDLLEQPLAEVPLRDGNLEFSLGPFEIKTFRVTFRGP